MVEGARWPGEAAAQWDGWLFPGSDFGIEGTLEDAVQAADIDQVEGQRPGTGRIQPLTGVLLAQAEQLLALPQLRPGQRTIEELRGEGFDIGTKLRCPGHHPVRSTQGVGCLLLRVVVRVGGTPTTGLTRMDLDQLSLPIEPRPLRVRL